MWDDLAMIERNYGCVAEYNRSRYEDECYEYEMYEKRSSYYAKSKAREKAAKDAGYEFIAFGNTFCDKCTGCTHFCEVGMRDDTDDIGLTYCDNKECPMLKGYLEEQDRQARDMEDKRKAFAEAHPYEYGLGAYRWDYELSDWCISDVEFYERLANGEVKA